MMWITWMYFRMFAYPYGVYESLYYYPRQIPNWFADSHYEARFVMNWLLGLTAFLHVLNIWWAYLITIMIYRGITKGKSKDLQEKID